MLSQIKIPVHLENNNIYLYIYRELHLTKKYVMVNSTITHIIIIAI